MSAKARRSVAPEFRPKRPPAGTDNFGNLFRDPMDVMQELVAERLAARGFGDLRPSLLAVGQHVRAEGSRITELAERARISKASVVQTVDELERLGYAERTPDPTDGRAKLVVATAKAREAEAAAREIGGEIRAAWAEAIGERRMATLEAALRELRAALWPPGEDAVA